MTINQLYKQLGQLIEHGYGRKQVCVDKSKCSHVLEADGAVIMPVSKIDARCIELMDGNGFRKELASGKTAQRTMLVIEAEHGTPSIDQPLQCQIEGLQLVETLMTQMLDRATYNAFENGSTAFDYDTKTRI